MQWAIITKNIKEYVNFAQPTFPPPLVFCSEICYTGIGKRFLPFAGAAPEPRSVDMDINKYTPKYKISQANLLRLSDISAEDIFEFLYFTKALKKKKGSGKGGQN